MSAQHNAVQLFRCTLSEYHAPAACHSAGSLWLSSILPTQTFVSVDIRTFGKEAVTFHQHCDWVVKENMFCNSEKHKAVKLILSRQHILTLVIRRVQWAQVGKSVRVWLSQGGKQHCLLQQQSRGSLLHSREVWATVVSGLSEELWMRHICPLREWANYSDSFTTHSSWLHLGSMVKSIHTVLIRVLQCTQALS